MESPENAPIAKKIKSPELIDLNHKSSITCEDVPESLFEATAARKHFSKFGRVQKIRFYPKRHMCIVEYEQPAGAEKAVLNAGAYDGFMFEVTRSKPLKRRRSKKDDDPEWVPDGDVQAELSAMSNTPVYRLSRQKPMDVEAPSPTKKPKPKPSAIRKSVLPRKPPTSVPLPVVEAQPQPMINSFSTLSTAEAASELCQLSLRVCQTPDERWRVLDARDKILRSWGGAGSREKVGGPTVGTCPDMCPEKERLHRQAEHQVMNLESEADSDGSMVSFRAVKQYSRSSADQEMPMCYELRPAPVLMRTCRYLLHEIVDTDRQISLADWFHFLWDRLRGIRKDITQQALCCSDSIKLVEICARFHAHCAARLADLEHTQFDQKLNTDNLTKCLQTLKHMYADVPSKLKPREAEFRGYIALLNMGDANFWWEIKQLPQNIQKSPDILFAIRVFNALDNNNYVRFFRLVREQATYLQACILLRYFNDVRARALARIVKAFAPRGGSRYPAHELMNALAYETLDSMKAFVKHYGLRIGVVEDEEMTVILDRNQFIEDSDPFPTSRAIQLIESKRNKPLSEVIGGECLPKVNYNKGSLYTSFKTDGTLRLESLVCSDQGYDTVNDTNKDLSSLITELLPLLQNKAKSNVLVKPETAVAKRSPKAVVKQAPAPVSVVAEPQPFAFKPAIPVAPKDIINTSPDKIFSEVKSTFSFSKPQVFGTLTSSTFMQSKVTADSEPAVNVTSIFKPSTNSSSNIFSKNVPEANTNKAPNNNNIFAQNPSANVFVNPDPVKFEKGGNIFSNSTEEKNEPSNIFGNFKSNAFNVQPNLFSQASNSLKSVALPTTNGESGMSPRSIFKTALNQPTEKPPPPNYSIFQTKNNDQSNTVASNIFNSFNNKQSDVYDFDSQADEQSEAESVAQQKEEYRRKQEERLQEIKRQEEKLKQLQQQEKLDKLLEDKKKQEDERRKEEVEKQRIREEEEQRIREEEKRKQEEIERKAELKRQAEENERKFKECVDKESLKTVDQLVEEINMECVEKIIKEEQNKYNELMAIAENITDFLTTDLCEETCTSELKCIIFRRDKLCKKWFSVWRKHRHRNLKRRDLLDDTPVWLSSQPPQQTAAFLRRSVEQNALKNMNSIHRGYRFSGEPNIPPAPAPYSIMEVIRTALLKRMRQINYPYDKCFFWKITLLSPGPLQFMHRKIDVEKWALDAFSDKQTHEVSDTLIQVGRHSWNNLMDFAISVSLANQSCERKITEALEGSNGLLIYAVDANELTQQLDRLVNQNYPYQVLPVAIVLQKFQDSNLKNIENILVNYVNDRVILKFKIFLVEPGKVHESMYSLTRNAMKWLARNYPEIPSLEIDHLKSIIQRYLGNEIWCTFKSSSPRFQYILKDLNKLVSLYNLAVDKLTEMLTNEDLFNYPNFALEFSKYLDHTSSFPRPMEFITSNVKNSDNTETIRRAMNLLKLPNVNMDAQPSGALKMQENIRNYCKQIGWFENPEEVVCKAIAIMPNELSDTTISSKQFYQSLEQYSVVDLLNIIVYEKIGHLNSFNNLLAIYEKSALDEYKSALWLHETEVISNLKHKAIEYEDDPLEDFLLEAKRRKLGTSFECLMLEDNDITLVEDDIKINDERIKKLNEYKESVNQIEEQIEEERLKSIQLDNLLRSALSDSSYKIS